MVGLIHPELVGDQSVHQPPLEGHQQPRVTPARKPHPAHQPAAPDSSPDRQPQWTRRLEHLGRVQQMGAHQQMGGPCAPQMMGAPMASLAHTPAAYGFGPSATVGEGIADGLGLNS